MGQGEKDVSRKMFFTTKEVGSILGVDMKTAAMWAYRNGIGKQKIGNHYVFMFTRDKIREYQESRYRSGETTQRKVSIPY